MSSFEGTPVDVVAAIAKYSSEAALGLGSCIYVSEATNLATIPAPGAGTSIVSTDITMDSSKVFFPWRISDTDVEFSSNAVGAKGSQSFRNVCTVFIPVSRDVVDTIMNGTLNDEFVLIVPDKKGEYYIFGTEFAPAQIAEGGVQKVLNNERNGTLITFEYLGHMPYRYTGAIPLT